MKRFIFLFTVALILNSSSFAEHSEDNSNSLVNYDHSGANYYQASNLAYQLAELGERWAYRSYDYRLSQSAHDLHDAASALYHFLRNQRGGGGFGFFEHNRGYSPLDQMLYRVGNAVERFAFAAPHRAGSAARSYYNSLWYNLGR